MKKPSDSNDADYDIGDLLGLGSQSVRKNYYPALQERMISFQAGLEQMVLEKDEALRKKLLGD